MNIGRSRSKIARAVHLLRWIGFVLGLAGVAHSEASERTATATDDFTVPVVDYAFSHASLRDWMILGPFQARPGEEAAGRDFLAEQGCGSESGMNPGHYSAIVKKAHERGGELGRIFRVSGLDQVEFMNLYKKNICPGEGAGSAYAACVVDSAEDREAWLLAASNYSLTVRLNGERLHSYALPRALQPYDQITRLKLQRGKNFLLLKCGNTVGAWNLAACLEPTFEQALKTITEEEYLFLEHHVFMSSGAILNLRVRGVPPDQVVRASAMRFDGKIRREFILGADAVNLPAGVYRLGLKLGQETSRETVLVKDPDEVLTELVRRVAGFQNDDRQSININTLVFRCRHLLKPENRKPDDKEWERKIVFTMTELEKILGDLEGGREAFMDVPGLHLRGFRSVIDDQVQHYRLFIPENYRPEGEPLPIIVIQATPMSASRPFLESAFVANQKEAEEMAKIAARLGVGILWPGYRCPPYGNPCEFTHFEEVLRAVGENYHIDEHRVSLLGICGAGMTAAMLADLHPQRFASIALLNPVLYRQKYRFDDSGEYAGLEAYRAWLKETDPMDKLAMIRDLPTWIVHDGVDPGHGPLSHSVAFYELARAYGNAPRFDHVEYGGRATIWNNFFTWMTRQRREKVAAAGAPTTAENGPISRVFAGRFVVVEASRGNETEKAESRRISQSFQAAWHRTQFGDCRVVQDTELNEQEERTSNLVIIGNARTNAIWGRLVGQLPMKLSGGAIEIDGNRYEGNKLSIQCLAVHPNGTGRRIVFIGGEDLASAKFGTQELAIDGWFDYAIWDSTGGEPKLIDAKRYKSGLTNR
jgi:pimeloyl-ACP methyl ester carboxylesterase